MGIHITEVPAIERFHCSYSSSVSMPCNHGTLMHVTYATSGVTCGGVSVDLTIIFTGAITMCGQRTMNFITVTTTRFLIKGFIV